MPSFFSRLFGGSAPAKEPEPELYKDCRITPAPIREAGGWRVAARIEKDFPGGTRTHQMGRADTFSSVDEARDLAISKAKQAIDQLGDRLFDGG